MRIVVGITGASGAIYGVRLLEVLADRSDVETHLLISPPAERVLRHETTRTPEEVASLADSYYAYDDLFASLASGSFLTDGMVVVPCSMKTLSAIAHSHADNLLARAADVTLKELRRLVLVVRETPLHVGHLELMAQAARLGAVILPPVPAFYHHPETVAEVVDHTVGRILDMFRIEHALTPRWGGL